MVELKRIPTERRNEATAHIDRMSTLEMVRLINQEDHKVADAVGREAQHIARAVDIITGHMKQGGRLIYVGAGTSGRLGILDAVECPPTYSTEPELVQGLIAGGTPAIFRAVEGAEDDPNLGRKDLEEIHYTKQEVLVGIAASGRTPYVIGALESAKSLGGVPIGVTCCPGSRGASNRVTTVQYTMTCRRVSSPFTVFRDLPVTSRSRKGRRVVSSVTASTFLICVMSRSPLIRARPGAPAKS